MLAEILGGAAVAPDGGIAIVSLPLPINSNLPY